MKLEMRLYGCFYFNIYFDSSLFENGQCCKGFNDILNEIISSAAKHSNGSASPKKTLPS